MKSRSKTILSNEEIVTLFHKAGMGLDSPVSSLGDGEFNAVYAMGPYCIKVAPKKTTKVLTYEQNMIQSELFWYHQIENLTNIPIPKRLAEYTNEEELPAPWFMMEQIEGAGMDRFTFLSETEKKNAHLEQIRFVSKIHQISADKFGYVQNGLYDNWYLALSSMVSNLINDAQKMNHPSSRGEKLLEYIEKNKSILEKVQGTMVNFDLWPSNIMCTRKKDKIEYSWIDPERSFYGDPLGDFVCFEFLRPIEDKTKTIKVYNEYVNHQIMINDEVRIRYALMEGYLGLIMEVEKYYRYSRTNPGWARNIVVSRLLYKNAFSVLKNY